VGEKEREDVQGNWQPWLHVLFGTHICPKPLQEKLAMRENWQNYCFKKKKKAIEGERAPVEGGSAGVGSGVAGS